MSFIFKNPFSYFNNPNNSNPVGLGNLYIGLPDLDPSDESNQIPVFAVQQDGSELQIPQPVRTTAGGTLTYNGSPIQLKTNASLCSVKVTSSAGSQLYYAARAESIASISSITQLQEEIDALDERVAALEESAGDLRADLISSDQDKGTSLVRYEDGRLLSEIITELLNMSSGSTNYQDQKNFPYEWSYPNNSKEETDMRRQAGNQSIGYGGSTWHVRPCAIGRKENGIDVIYRGTTYGSAEDRQYYLGAAGETDLTLNQKLGQAIICVAKLSIEEANSVPYYTFDKVGINDRLVSYREDEHHQPAVCFNNTNGQLITAWGSRNSAVGEIRTDRNGPEGPIVMTPNTDIVHVRYGQSLDSLSASELCVFSSTIDYSQIFFAGNTAFLFARDDIGNWSFVTGSGGQNWQPSVQMLDSPTEQYYIDMSYVDTTYAGENPANPTTRPTLHMFFNSHPTLVADGELRYTRGTFYAAGSIPSSAPKNAGGMFLANPTDNSSPSGTGKLASGLVPFNKTDVETAYTAAAGHSIRLLDVEYGQTPRALIAVFDFDWSHGGSVPFGKTYDLVLVEFNTASLTWGSVVLKTGLRGMLGYLPTQARYGADLNPIEPFEAGVEGYTSAYIFGASFWRGVNHHDTRPIIYYCDRDGDDTTSHRMTEMVLSGTYDSVVSETALIENSKDIIYRPEMTLYGDKRFVWYNSGGWSNFNSWVAQDKFIDVMTTGSTKVAAAAPVFDIQPLAVLNTTPGTNNVRIHAHAVSYGGDKIVYQWEFSDTADTGPWSDSTAGTGVNEFTITAPAADRWYRLKATNATGFTYSNVLHLNV